jgi:hypothetical protein
MIVGKHVPQVVKPNADQQGQCYLDEGGGTPRTEGKSYVAVETWKSRDEGIANLTKNPKCQKPEW